MAWTPVNPTWGYADGGTQANTSAKWGQVGGGRADQGIYEESSTQNYPLGYRMEFDDGRVFRYAHFVAATNRGLLVSQDVSVSLTASIDGKFTNSAGTAKDDYGTTDNVIYLTDTDTFSTNDAADVYAGGYLHLTDAAGEGYTYRIKSNDVGTSAGLMKLELYDNLAAALDSESSCSITGNMFRNLRGAVAGTDNLVVGVTPRTFTAAYYGWVQTNGVCTVLADEESTGAITAGCIAVLSDDVTGAVGILGQGTQINSEALITSDFTFAQVATEPIVGYFCNTAVDTEHTAVYLTLGV